MNMLRLMNNRLNNNRAQVARLLAV